MTDSLQPRKLALSVLHLVQRGGKDTDFALEEVLGTSGLDKRDRAFTQLLALGTLRHRAVADALLAQCLQKPLDAKKADYVQDVLRMGVAQLLWLGVPSHAAVHSSVELVKQSKFKGFAKLVNGVLQRIHREGAAMQQKLDIPRLTTPDWLWHDWVDAYGEATTRQIAEANLLEPMLDISVKSDAEGWAKKLDGEVMPTGTVRLSESADVTTLEGFAEGEWWVQDMAAALPVRLFGDIRGKRVLDLCAAPGGKTVQLALRGAEVTALDRSAKRMRRVRENLERMQLSADIVTADALEWQPDEAFDAILLDAPCSATGTLRRHPDVAWRKSPKDVAELAGLQRRLLERALTWLKPNGVLVYSTCSLEKAEGEDHMAHIAAMGARISPVQAVEVGGIRDIVSHEGWLRCLPHHMQHKGGMDGFFAVRLEKN
jgi:16S rRNA (cytosine967-C5)-methyltransferase